jgi:teichuronic acid biosynthesis glycosyltransferase TuaH
MSRWDEPYSSTIFSLAKEFAHRHRVFYIDHPYTIKDFWQANKQANAPHRRKALLFGNDILPRLLIYRPI